MSTTRTNKSKRALRHARIRARVQGTATRPRISVYRSNVGIYAQLIDDTTAHTIAAADSRSVTGDSLKERAGAVGEAIAAAAKKAGIEQAVFDRGGFQYHGTVQAVAEGARKGGLTF